MNLLSLFQEVFKERLHFFCHEKCNLIFFETLEKHLENNPSFCKLFSKHLWQILFSVKFHAFTMFFWTRLNGCLWIIKIILWGESYSRHKNNNHTTKSLLKKLLMETHLKWKPQVPFKWSRTKSNNSIGCILSFWQTIFSAPEKSGA